MHSQTIKPLVSVAVATYNGGKYLRSQLNTIVGQTYPNLQIVVSDDGSTDGTLEILKEYAEKYPNFSFYNNKAPHGIKKNFENALKYCTGTYIAFSDQDDIWMPDKIEKLVSNIDDYSLIYHNSLFVDYEGNSLEKTFADKLKMYEGFDSRAFLICNTVSGHALLFHRKMLDIVLPFPDARHHDWWLAFRAAENGGVKYFDEVLVHYRQHPHSQTDFFNLKKEKINAEALETEENEWFETCAGAPGRHQAFFKKWARVFKIKNQHFWNPQIIWLSLKGMNTVFFMRKKNKFSTFFFILRMNWGRNTKDRFREVKNTVLLKEDESKKTKT